jgi:predicted MFS family arabinose efflux permease
MLGYYAYMQATLGPGAVFIRNELHLDYSQQALHISAFALGMLLTGLMGAQIIRFIGPNLAFWGGGAGMAVGGLLVTLGRTPVVTVGSAFVMGYIGSYLLVTIQTGLSGQHREQRAYALTEANVVAVLAAGLAPILVGQGEALGLGWRVALYAGLAGWLLMAITSRHVMTPQTEQFTDSSTPTHSQSGKLPSIFWVYWLVVLISVSVEWCMIFWCASFLQSALGLSSESAATASAVFYIAQFIGRGIGSRLVRTSDSRRLLIMAGLLTLAGFPLFWLARTPVLNMLGLFICGLGVANLYPLILSTTSAIGIMNPNAASGYISMASGAAILITPQILGVLADHAGIQNAYAIVLPLAVGIVGVTLGANHRTRD